VTEDINMAAQGDQVTKASECYSKGNESFVNEDYSQACELYTAALQTDPLYTEALVARAHALIKTEKFEDAKKDADKAIDIMRSELVNRDSTVDTVNSPLAAKAFLRSGVASFHLGRYREARNCFVEGGKVPGSEAGLGQWLVWCDEKIEKFGDTAPGVRAVKTPNKTDDTKSSCDSEAAKAETAGEPPSSSYDSQAMPVPKITHDWYQTETQVVIEIRIKKLAANMVQVDIGDTTLSVTAKIPSSDKEYSLELDLAHPVTPAQSGYKVMTTKIEIKLKKAEGVRWAALEGDGSAPLPGGVTATASGAAAPVKGPYASGRDWAAIEKNLAAEAEEKKEGEAALNEMFQKIYGDASDDTKRAMNKSFQESGGTVLSTNWGDIGKEKTEIKPPDGMEWKKY